MPANSSPPAERVLVMSRRRSTGMLAVAVVCAVVGVYWIAVGFLPGWLVIAFFGWVSLVWAAELVRPSALRLDEAGFVLTQPLRRSRRRRWSECSRFVPWGPTPSRRKPSVRYRSGGDDKVLRRAARAMLWGGDEVISAGFGRLTARQLAELMNRCREEAVGRPPDQPPGAPRDDEPGRPGPRPRRRSLISAVLFVLAQAFLVGAYFAYRVGGGAVVGVPLAIAGVVCFLAYVWRD